MSAWSDPIHPHAPLTRRKWLAAAGGMAAGAWLLRWERTGWGPAQGKGRQKEGLRVRIDATADQGYTLRTYGGANGAFAGQPARVIRRPGQGEMVIVHSRRRLVQLKIDGAEHREKRALLEKILAPTFAARPKAAAKPAKDD